MNLQIIGYIFEFVAIIAGVIAGYSALKKDPKYKVNQLMAAAMFSLALYVTFIMLYDIVFYITGNPSIVYISYPQALVFIIAGAMFLYLSMEAILKSTEWLKIWWHWGIHLVLLIGFAIVINIVDFIDILESESVDTQINIYILGVVILIVLYYLITSFYITYFHGIRKTTNTTQKKLKIFEIGLLIDILAVFVNIYSQITTNETMSPILDMIFFAMIAIGNIIYSIGFLLPSEDSKACIKCPTS